jgi:predicted GNAT family N-acyltransferase
MSELSIEILASSHKKKQFDCNNRSLNDYLHKRAKQDVKRKLASCFILTDIGKNVLGYYTLSNASIPKDLIPENLMGKLPYQDLPVTLLGRLAIDVNSKGKGFGKLLLIDALKRCFEISSQIASIAIIVDPIDKNAVAFYLKYGFIKLQDSGRMFLPMKTIAQLFK